MYQLLQNFLKYLVFRYRGWLYFVGRTEFGVFKANQMYLVRNFRKWGSALTECESNEPSWVYPLIPCIFSAIPYFYLHVIATVRLTCSWLMIWAIGSKSRSNPLTDDGQVLQIIVKYITLLHWTTLFVWIICGKLFKDFSVFCFENGVLKWFENWALKIEIWNLSKMIFRRVFKRELIDSLVSDFFQSFTL